MFAAMTDSFYTDPYLAAVYDAYRADICRVEWPRTLLSR